jgi:hypothetical protein
MKKGESLVSNSEGEIKIFNKAPLRAGMTLYDHVVEMCGEKGCEKFSKGIDIKKIKVICLLGQGAYAKVYLVEKLDKTDTGSTFYAMKVLDKRDLK